MTGRTVLTTGANSGIGLATVLELGRRGFRSVGSVRSKEKAKVVALAARAASVDVEAMLLGQRLTPTFLKDRVIRFGLGI